MNNLRLFDSSQIKLFNELMGLFRRFCRANGLKSNELLTREGVDRIRAVIETIEDEREEEDKRVQETLDDARSSVYP